MFYVNLFQMINFEQSVCKKTIQQPQSLASLFYQNKNLLYFQHKLLILNLNHSLQSK